MTWLLKNADASIQYNLVETAENAELLLQNGEASVWLSRLEARSQSDTIGDIPHLRTNKMM